MTRTRVMATLTADQCTPDFIGRMAAAGMSGVRFNSAHVDFQQLADIILTVRRAAPATVVLIDTKGPEIRTSQSLDPIPLTPGTTVLLPAEAIVIPRFSFTRGDSILIDDGTVELNVESVFPDGTLLLKTIRGSVIEPLKTVSSPAIDRSALPAVSERDRRAIDTACSAGAQIIAHSFVRSPEDIRAARAAISNPDVALYAKIETPEAILCLDDIIRTADGILVARGDLGSQIPLPRIPTIQLDIARKCHAAGKPMIIATQILESMISSPQPTRAELSDIALGVAQGAAWMLLCGETARGKFPVETVDIMQRTILNTENSPMQCSMI